MGLITLPRFAIHWAKKYCLKAAINSLDHWLLRFEKLILRPTKDGSMGDKVLVVDDELLIR